MSNAVLGRWRTALLPIAAVACFAIVTLAGARPVGAAAPPISDTVTVTVAQGPISRLPAGQAPQSSARCAPALGKFDRTDMCWESTFKVAWRRNGVVVSTRRWVLEQSIHLRVVGKTWTEDDTVVSVSRPTGTPESAHLRMHATCDTPCTVRSHFAGALEVGLHGTIDSAASIGQGVMHTFLTRYELITSSPGFSTGKPVRWKDPRQYRCDNDLRGIAGQGCVFSEFTPALVLSKGAYGASAAMIAWAQKHMHEHWGERTRGKPLSRIAKGKNSDANRRRICNATFRRIDGIGAGFHDTDSCDEFPFAATNQSGALNGVRSGKSCAQLVAVRTSKVGDEARQWHGVRATGNPTGREKCVRGHILNKLNIAVGQAYKKFIKTQRLLNDDQFWLEVVS